MHKHYPIQASRIEFTCDCGKGVFRLVHKNPYFEEKIYQWRHACTDCGQEAYFTVPYPIIESHFSIELGLHLDNFSTVLFIPSQVNSRCVFSQNFYLQFRLDMTTLNCPGHIPIMIYGLSDLEWISPLVNQFSGPLLFNIALIKII